MPSFAPGASMSGGLGTVHKAGFSKIAPSIGLLSGAGPFHGGASGTLFPTFYVNNSGSDSNPGTQSQPWQTISKVNAQTFSPGTTVYFSGGQTFTGTLTIPNGGSVGKPVKVASYGAGQATISPGANANGIVTTNLSYFTIQNLTVVGSGTTTQVDGIQINQTTGSATGVLIDNCNCSGFSHDGIMLNVTGGSIINPTITNCTTNGNATGVFNNGAGIQLRGVYGAQNTGVYSFINPYIFNCTANNNLGAAGTSNWTGSGIHTAQCFGGIILSCLADSNGANCNATSGASGIWTSDSSGHVIQSCESSNNSTSAVDGCGFDMDGGTTGCITQYCYSHGNYGGGLLSFSYADPSFIQGNFNNIIRFNVSMNDASGSGTSEGSIYAVAGSGANNTGLQIYGNTVYTTGTSATSACAVFANSGGTMSGTIANNIFISRSSSKLAIASGGNSFAVTGNCYWPTAGQAFSLTWAGTTYSSYSAWQTATGLEKIGGVNVGLNTDPLIVNAGYSAPLASSTISQKNSFKLASTSPCLGAGVNLLTQYAINAGGRDYYGNTVPRSGATYDMGCATGAATLSTVTSAYVGQTSSTTSGTVFTMSPSFSITSDPSTVVYLSAFARGAGSTTTTLTSLTVNGIAATMVNDSRNTNGGALSTQSGWIVSLPNVSSITSIVATYSATMARCGVIVRQVQGASSGIPRSINASVFTDATTAATAAFAATMPVGGALFIDSSEGTGTAAVLTPTNYTLDLAGTGVGTSFFGGGHATSSGSPNAYTSTWAGGSATITTMVSAAFLPMIS